MIIEGTNEAYGIALEKAHTICELLDITQQGNWIQIDKQQATQIIEVLQRWVNGEEIE